LFLTALVKAVGTDYKDDLTRKEIYNTFLNFALKTSGRKRIKQSSASTAPAQRPRGTVARLVAGDETTWGEVGDDHRTEIDKDSPQWHAGLEEEEEAHGPKAHEHGCTSCSTGCHISSFKNFYI
jgi:hypothetical protein